MRGSGSLPDFGLGPMASDSLVVASALLCSVLLGWRLWMFTLRPLLWPNEPKYLPYWVPFIGHSLGFVRNPETLINNGFRYFESSQPFSLVVGGRTLTIIRDVHDVATIWRNTQALSIDPFVVQTLGAFGMSKSTLKKIFADPRELVLGQSRSKSLLINQNPQNKAYMDLERDWFTSQLMAPKPLQMLLDRYLIYLRQSLMWEDLSPTYTLSSELSSHTCSKTVSLAKFCQYTVSYCSITTFFGSKLQDLAPDFLHEYQEFEKQSWKIFYRLPSFLAKSSHRAKDKAIDGLVTYMNGPDEVRSELQWVFRVMISELGYLGVDNRDIASFVMVFIWAINNNAHKVGFWILAHLLHDSAYRAILCSEIDAAYAAPDGNPEMDVLLSACPHLDAIWYETMRFYNATSAIREALSPCTVGGKSIRVNEQVMAPFRQFLLSREIFGHDADSFRPQRFLENKSLHRVKGYSPFGGGHTYCPGRSFAQREIYLFVAETLRKFDLELMPRLGGTRMPEVDKNTPSAAAMGPDEDVLVKLRPRVHGPLA